VKDFQVSTTKKDFWSNSTVAVIGGGSWGTVLAQLAAQNCAEVRIWVRSEAQAREMNATRANKKYLPAMTLSPKIRVTHEIEKVFEAHPALVVWALPSQGSREQAKRFARFFTGEEILIHATKGLETGTLKRMSEILAEEIPSPRVGVISGPNLAHEISRGEPAATVVASAFDEVIQAGQAVFTGPTFRVYGVSDVVGVEWAGTLKNILAIAAGTLDAMGLGWNARAMLIARGLAEMVRFGTAMGGNLETFLGLAGVGDLLATCSSNLSRNYRVGARLAKGDALSRVLEELGATAEGVKTAQSVWEFAEKRGIDMPITHGVCLILEGKQSASDVLNQLMKAPLLTDVPS
jgi:glycerol-3-phosphate dehydrogenase (NAD(P)+)